MFFSQFIHNFEQWQALRRMRKKLDYWCGISDVTHVTKRHRVTYAVTSCSSASRGKRRSLRPHYSKMMLLHLMQPIYSRERRTSIACRLVSDISPFYACNYFSKREETTIAQHVSVFFLLTMPISDSICTDKRRQWHVKFANALEHMKIATISVHCSRSE
jgi:hypothetical protein